MSFKKSIQKTKNLFFKTLQSLKNYLFGSYEKIPRIIFLNPLSCSSINQRSHQLDHIYPHFMNQLGPDQNNASHPIPSNEARPMVNNTDANHNNDINFDHKNQQMVLSKRKIEASPIASLRYDYETNGAYILAKKMKEFEMMDLGDINQSLDVEEALHYYSRLTCPVYVDIVNKFFMDMYADFLPRQPSISTSTSSRRLGPLTL